MAVERFDHLRGRQRSRKFCSGGAFRWREQRVEGLEVCRMGDVDDGLAGELIGITSEDVRQSRSTDADARSQRRVLPGPHEHAAARSVICEHFLRKPA